MAPTKPILTLKKATPVVEQAPTPKKKSIPPCHREWHANPKLSEKFWFIWAPSARKPKYRHPSLEVAMAEAQRLKALNPDQEFHIFEAHKVGAV